MKHKPAGCKSCQSLLRQIADTRANERRVVVGGLLAMRVVPPVSYDDIVANHTLENTVRKLIEVRATVGV